jgi:hypothetical protein
MKSRSLLARPSVEELEGRLAPALLVCWPQAANATYSPNVR